MINLLPDERKHEIRAARANVILLRYNLFTLIALGFLVIACAAFFFVLRNEQSNAISTNNVNVATAQSYKEVQAETEAYRSNLSIASQILSKSINYSSFLFSITELLPSDVIIDNITLDAESFTKQTTFIARATSYEKATELKDSFQNSKLFTNVFFQNLVDNSASSSGGSSSDYPITVTISAKINKAELE